MSIDGSWTKAKRRARLKRLLLVWRWRTVLWKQSRAVPTVGAFSIQVGQNSLDDSRIFNAAVRRLDDDLDLTGAPLAGLDIDVA